MVLERSFDSADLKRMLARSEMVVDRSLMANTERRHDPANISRPPLPKGSQVFEKVLDEFQPDRQAPNIRVTRPSLTLAVPSSQHHDHQEDLHHLRPVSGRSRPSSSSRPRSGSRSGSRSGQHRAGGGVSGGNSGSPRSRRGSDVRDRSPSRGAARAANPDRPRGSETGSTSDHDTLPSAGAVSGSSLDLAEPRSETGTAAAEKRPGSKPRQVTTANHLN